MSRKVRMKFFFFEILTSLMRFGVVWLKRNEESKSEIFFFFEILTSLMRFSVVWLKRNEENKNEIFFF